MEDSGKIETVLVNTNQVGIGLFLAPIRLLILLPSSWDDWTWNILKMIPFTPPKLL